MLSARARVAVRFAQQGVGTVEVFADKAHGDHRPVPVVRVVHGGAHKRHASVAVDFGNLGRQVVCEDAAHGRYVDLMDRRLKCVPRPAPRVAAKGPEGCVVSEAKRNALALRETGPNGMVPAHEDRRVALAGEIALNGAWVLEAEVQRHALKLRDAERAKLEASVSHLRLR